jgi:hypothetical protein
MADHATPWSELSSFERTRLAKRLLHRLRTAWNEGATIFALSAFVLVLSFLLFRTYWSVSSQRELLTQQSFNATFGTQQEPRDNLEYPAASAAILSAVNEKSTDVICDPASNIECQAGKDVLDVTSDLFAEWSSRGMTSDDKQLKATSWVSGVFSKYLPNVVVPMSWVDGIPALLTQPPERPMECRSIAPQDPETTSGLGDAGCLLSPSPSGLITLVAPDTFRSWDTGPASKGVTSKDESEWRQVMRVASLLDYGVDLAKRHREHDCGPSRWVTSASSTPASATPCGKNHSVRWVAAYFISPENVLRFWTAGTSNGLTDLPRSKPWTSASYFKHFVTGKDPVPSYRSLAYLDLGGNGIVRTECRPLQTYGNGERKLLGVICVDYALSLVADPQFLAGLTKNPFLDFVIVHISPNMDVTPVSTPPLRTASESLLKSLASSIKQLTTKISWADLTKSVRPLAGKQPGFLLPMAKLPTGELEAVVILPKSSGSLTAERVLLGAGLFVGTAWLALVAFGAWSARNDSEMRERIALFRSLQVGAVETKGEELTILRANDRAEELLGVKLPKDRSALDGESFWEMVDVAVRIENDPWPGFQRPVQPGSDVPTETDSDESAEEDSDAPANAGNDVSKPKEPYLRIPNIGEIVDQRKSGATTRYWVRLKSESSSKDQRWLMVIAGPMIRGQPIDRTELFTIGIIMPASETRRRSLERWWQSHLNAVKEV